MKASIDADFCPDGRTSTMLGKGRTKETGRGGVLQISCGIAICINREEKRIA